MIRDRYFEERAFLKFVFPKKGSSKNSNFTVKLPLYENPNIAETKSARLAKYQVLGRTSNYYSYLGSDSRQLTLSFNITLPHLYQTIKDITPYHITYSYTQNLAFEKDRFITVPESRPDSVPIQKTGQISPEIGNLSTIRNHEKAYKDKFKREAGLFDNIVSDSIGFLTNQLKGLGDLIFGAEPESPSVTRQKVKSIYYFWIGLLRASAIGGYNCQVGPPTVRLTFGPLYQDVPFVVSKYDLSIDENAGYDLETLLPNRVKFTLSLEELRVGDFSDFEPNDIIKGDNAGGWEAIIDYGTLDPRTSGPNEGGNDG